MDHLGSTLGKTIDHILTTMDEVIAKILHDHNYFTDQETECAGKFIDVPENLKHILHDHDYIRHIFNPETIKHTDLNWWCAEGIAETDDYVIYDTTEEAREMDVIEETLYPEEKFQDDVYMFQGNVQNILGSSTLDRTVKLNFSTNKANRHSICGADNRGLSRPANFDQISSNNNGLNHTLNSNVIQMNNKIMESLYNIERLTNLTSIKTTKNVEDQSVLFADKTILDSYGSIIMFDHPIKQEEDCDVYDPEMTVETLSTSMLDDLTSVGNIKIEECVLEWNDKNIDSSYMGEDIVRSEIKSDSYIVEEDSEVAYTNLILCKYCNEGFITSESKLKHECVCKCARRLVIELRREVEATRAKKPRKNAPTRDQKSCWSGIEEVWKHKKEKTAEIEKSSRVQKKEDIDEKRFACDKDRIQMKEGTDEKILLACVHCSFKSEYKANLERHTLEHYKDGRLQKKEDIDEKRFACDHCLFKTKYKKNLKRHRCRRHKDRTRMKGNTDKKILLACVHCAFKTEYKANLERHTLEHYEDDRVQGKKTVNVESWFACISCNYKSEYKSSVQRHMQKKHGEFVCYHCRYCYSQKISLIQHLLKDGKKKKYRCSKCNFVAYCRPALRTHEKNNHKTKNDCVKFLCPHCPSIYASKYHVGDHILQSHPEFSDSVTQKIHKCNICMFQTTSTIRLGNHLLKHSDVKPYECEMCGFKTKWRTMLGRHILKSCPKKVQEQKPINETSWFECIHCNYKSERKASVNRHMQMDHGNSMKDDSTVESVNRHMQMKHGKTGFICYHCDHSFRDKYGLIYHLLKYREKKKYRCSRCSFVSYCRPALRTHVKNKHKTKNDCEKFQCPHCPSIFASKCNVSDHILRKHPEFSDSVTQKIHKCSICMFQTTYKIHLRDHLLKHSDVKPYECEMCGYKTKWRTQLDHHILKSCRKKVQEKKPINETSWFECIHCNYKSEWEASVNRHMQMDHGNSVKDDNKVESVNRHMQMDHGNSMKDDNTVESVKHGKTGFICYHCDHSFHKKSTLVYHLLKYREKNQYKCGKCSFVAYCRPALRTHVKYEHKTKKEREKFQCPHCPSIFAIKYNVGDHILQKHPEFSDSVTQKIHKCNICMYQTTYKIHLRDHLLKHSDVRPFKCEICGKKTKSKSGLDRHIVMSCRKN